MEILQQKAQASKSTIKFIGRAWVNEAKDGKYKGTRFLSLRLDRNVGRIALDENDRITLWPATKRAGRQDADFRVSVAV